MNDSRTMSPPHFPAGAISPDGCIISKLTNYCVAEAIPGPEPTPEPPAGAPAEPAAPPAPAPSPAGKPVGPPQLSPSQGFGVPDATVAQSPFPPTMYKYHEGPSTQSLGCVCVSFLLPPVVEALRTPSARSAERPQPAVLAATQPGPRPKFSKPAMSWFLSGPPAVSSFPGN